jgi:predicted TPR repeat methyltransferase
MSSTKRSYFDEMYQGDTDPWDFESSEYEHRKYAVTMASLPKLRYRSAFEPGCSIGVLTQMLATRCDRLLATDVVLSALNRARQRLGGLPHVVVAQGAIPEDWPQGTFDLVVLSEIAYYFDAAELASIVSLVAKSTEVGGHLVGVHWRGATDYPLTGDGAHEILATTPQFEQVVLHIETDFVLGIWERRA